VSRWKIGWELEQRGSGIQLVDVWKSQTGKQVEGQMEFNCNKELFDKAV